MEKRKSGDEFILHLSKLLYILLFLQESNEEKHHLIYPIRRKSSKIIVFAATEMSETLMGPG